MNGESVKRYTQISATNGSEHTRASIPGIGIGSGLSIAPDLHAVRITQSAQDRFPILLERHRIVPARRDDQVVGASVVRRHLGSVQSEDLSDHPFEPTSSHGVADTPSDRETQAMLLEPVRLDVHSDRSTRLADLVRIDRVEVARQAQPMPAPENELLGGSFHTKH